MNNKQTLTVKTEYGTFTRTTARTYTHIVIARDADDYIEQMRNTLADPSISESTRNWFTKRLSDSENFGAISWCGRLDLARKEAAKHYTSFKDIHIVEVATGKVVL